jgi:hypothetical protein
MSDVFRSSDYIYGDIPFSKADREPCIICGHPTGDCKDGNDKDAPVILFGSTVIETMKERQLVLVEETVYGERQITPFTKSKVLLAKKGTYITVEKAIELGIN